MTSTSSSSSETTTAIIVAAGRGRRLGPETAEIPKCMVQVAGRPILHRQMEALAAAGARRFVIVRGYLGERILPAPGHDVRFVENPDWASNNILTSLMFAESAMTEDFLFSYSDIVFATEHARRVASANLDRLGGIALVIDRLWRETYVGRVHHPISEAELASVAAPEGVVDRVGKTVVSADDAAGEFIGLARFSSSGAAALRREWRRARSAPGGLESPYGRAPHLRQAYLSDALNALAAQGVPLTPVFVDGRWREIDTEEDLARAHAVVDGWDAPKALPPPAGAGRAGLIGEPPRALDPDHWLLRLSGDEWQRAAEHELELCLAQLQHRAVRAGVTHARRAAGMAWNAVLTLHDEPRFGRSYMEHIHALADDPSVPEPVRAAAQLLRSAPTGPPALIHLGKPDLSVHTAAGVILAHARERVSAAALPGRSGAS